MIICLSFTKIDTKEKGDRSQETEVRTQNSGDRSQNSELRSQNSEYFFHIPAATKLIGSIKSGDRRQESEVRINFLSNSYHNLTAWFGEKNCRYC